MARKNISKTAIEGGRAAVCRELEDQEDRHNRRVWAHYCRAVVLDEDAHEPASCILIGGWDRYRSGREFADKLNPIRRWLQKRVGRKWNDVKSEISATFDRRSLAGRHVLDHIDGYVDERWDPWNVASGSVDDDGVYVEPEKKWSRRWRTFYVDAIGILRIEK